MTYYPTREQQTFKCQGCGQWFVPGPMNCAVAHAPGTCCHYSDIPSAGPDPTRYAEHIKNGAGWKEPNR